MATINTPRRSRVYLTQRGGSYVVVRIEYENAARNGWVVYDRPFPDGHPSIRELKEVMIPTMRDSGYAPVTFRWTS